MSDGRIVIDVAANTKGLEEAKKIINDFGKEIEKTGKGGSSSSRPFDSIGDSATKSEPSVKKMIASIGAAQLAVKALGVVTASLGDAITRVDTMNQFPKMMEQLGFSSEDATRSIETLSAGIDGLPTALDTVVSTTQRLALITKDLGESTKLTLALNNAFLASGKGPAEAARGMEQFTQMLSTGKVDMQSWKTLVETMPQALDMVSKSLLGAEAGQAQLYAALRDGDITFQQFTDAIIGANEELAVLAKTGTEGIGTSISNVRTAVVKGVANMIQALDELSEATTGKGIAGHFNSLKDVVNASFKVITGAIKGAEPVVKVLIVTLDLLLKTLKFLSPVIAGVVTSILLLKAVKTATQYFDAMQLIIKALNGTQTTYLAINKLMTTEAIAGTTAQKALAVAYGLLSGQLSIATVATTAFKGVMTALSGPLGWAIGAVSLAVAGFVVFKKTLGKASEEAVEMSDSLGKAATSTEELVNEISDSSSALDKQISSIENNEKANLSLVDSLEELMKKEEKTKADKQKIKKYVDELNSSVSGLNLVYNQERDALNESSDAMRARISVMSEQEKANASLERLMEIEREQIKVTAQLETNQRLLADAEKQRSETSWLQIGTHTALNESISDLEENNASLLETQKSLGVEMGVVEEAYNSQVNSMSQGVDVLENQLLVYDELSVKNQEVIDGLRNKLREYETTATDVFTKVETVIKGTTADGEEYVKSSTEVVGDMIETLQHNQETLKTLGENIGGLRTQFEQLGLDEAILDYFVDLGPEAAPYIQALADVSDEELTLVATTFAEGGETAVQALFDALGIDPADYPENFTNLIADMELSLAEQIEAADFNSVGEELGGNLVEGAVQGVEDNSETLSNATSDSAQDAIDSFKDTSGVQSPSTVFKGLTAYWVEGAVLGISENAQTLVTTVSDLAKKAVKPFQDIRSDFETAGRNAGISFENGLASREGNIVATARRIAQRASSAINNSLSVSGGTASRTSSGGVARVMSISEEPQMATMATMAARPMLATAQLPRMATMAARPMLATAQLPRIDTYSATGGYEYSGRNSAQSSINNSRQLKETQAVANQTLGVLKDLVDISERGFKRQIIAQSFIDKKNISEEINEPLQSVQRSNENINKLLRGEWT